MDDTILKLFPDNPTYVPDKASRTKAKEYMLTLFPEGKQKWSKKSVKRSNLSMLEPI